MRRKNVTRHMIKDYISQALLVLMQKKAYSQITIQEITKEAGVNRSTYYRNFTSKETIIQYVFSEIIDRFDELSGETPELSMPECISEMFDHFYEYRQTFLTIHRAGLSHLLLDAFNEYFRKLCGSEDNGHLLYEIAYHTGGIFNIFILWLDQDMQMSPESVAEAAVEHLFRDGIFERLSKGDKRTV